MKLVMLIFMSLFTLVSNTESKDKYLDEVNNAYEYYLYEENETTYYDIILVEGIIDGKFTYGLYFYSNFSRDYYIAISSGNYIYYPPVNARGDVEIAAIKLDKNKTYQVLVYNKNNNLQHPNMDLVLEPKDNESFLQSKDLISGNNKGIKLSTLSKSKNNGLGIADFFLIGSLLIIVSCLIVIVIFYKKKKGMFKEEIRGKDVFKFNEIIHDNFSDDLNYTDDDFELNVDNYEVNEYVDETPKQIYTRYGRLDDDELSGFNINEHLESLNYKTDYSTATEDEKNLIMIELIKLKDGNKITYDEYLEETLKLWKK